MSRGNISGRKIERAINSDDILGKEVIDTEGRFIGVVEKILIDPSTLEVIGIEVDKGFLRKGLTIGRSYIRKVTERAVFLKIRVLFEIKGMQVFDMNGARVGVVSEVELKGNKNKIRNIQVKIGIVKKINIPAEMIETIGYNVILNIEKKKLN